MEDGSLGCTKFFAMPLINLRSMIIIIISSVTMNRMTKKAAFGGPSSDETFPLKEKTKFYWKQLATRHSFI